MLVEDRMVTNVHVLFEDDTIEKAIQIMQKYNIRHLPVVNEEKKCIGIVTDRDIRSAVPSIFSTDEHQEIFYKYVKEIMTKEVITCHPLDYVEDIARLFYQHNIGCLPVEKNERLVGILTQTDVLQTFIELTAANKPGSKIEIIFDGKSKTITDIIKILTDLNVHIHNLLIYQDRQNPDTTILAIRLNTINPLPAISTLQRHGYLVKFPLSSGDANGQ